MLPIVFWFRYWHCRELEELYLWQTNVTAEYVEKLKTGKPGLKIIYKTP